MLLDYAQQSTTLRFMTQIDWAERFTAAIAREIERLRTRPTNKRSAQWLSDRTAELGHRVGRSRISDLETGRRKRMDITELIVLAEALEVPAVQLLFPGLPDGESEYLPGRTDTAWKALCHFTGETTPSNDLLNSAGKPNESMTIIRLLAQVDWELATTKDAKRREDLALTRYALRQNLAQAGFNMPDEEAPSKSRTELPDLQDIWNTDV